MEVEFDKPVWAHGRFRCRSSGCTQDPSLQTTAGVSALAPLTDRRSYRRFSLVRSHSSALEQWLTPCDGGSEGRSDVGHGQSPSGVTR